MTELLTLTVDQIKVGDILPDKSEYPVYNVGVVPGSHVTVLHASGYTWHAGVARPGDPFPMVRVQRRMA